MFFKNMTLTAKGKNMLLASNVNLDKAITYTKAKFGNGRLENYEIDIATDIKSTWSEQNINTVRIDYSGNDPKLIIEVTFTNQGMTEPQTLTEMGIFAKTKTGDELLFGYCLTNIIEGEEIQIETDYPLSFKISVQALISNDTNIINYINPDGFITREVLEQFKTQIENIGLRKIKGILTKNTRAINVPSTLAMPLTNRAVLNIEGDVYIEGIHYSIDTVNSTITLNEKFIFGEDMNYLIIDVLPPTYVKEELEKFFLKVEQDKEAVKSELDDYIDQNRENLKGLSIEKVEADGTDEQGGNIYNVVREDNEIIGTFTAPKGKNGNDGIGIKEINFLNVEPNGDMKYNFILQDDTEAEGFFIAPKGQKGDPFSIVKTYPSIADMIADIDNEEVLLGQYVIISSDDSDNGKLFEKSIGEYKFIIRMGGSSGKSAYESYLETTTDQPPKNEAEWANAYKDYMPLTGGTFTNQVVVQNNETTGLKIGTYSITIEV